MKTKKTGLSLRKEPNQSRSQDTMESIVKATAHILEKEGFEKTSTNKIAAKAGVSIGSLYQYFPTKESILALLMDKFMRSEIEMIDKVLSEHKSSTLEQTIRSIINASISTKKRNKRFTKIFAQKIFSFNKMDALKKVDDYMMDQFKIYIKPFEKDIRMENLDMSLWISIQCVKLVPVAIMFQESYDLDDPKMSDELVHLIYQYLKV